MSKYKKKTEKILKLYKRTDILANGGENMKKERKHVNFQNNYGSVGYVDNQRMRLCCAGAPRNGRGKESQRK